MSERDYAGMVLPRDDEHASSLYWQRFRSTRLAGHMTAGEVAHALGLTVETVRVRARTGTLEATRSGGQFWFKKAHIADVQLAAQLRKRRKK